MIQAEAICTLSELAWTLPQSSVDICRGCLELVVAAMEHHSSVSELVYTSIGVICLYHIRTTLIYTLHLLACQGT